MTRAAKQSAEVKPERTAPLSYSRRPASIDYRLPNSIHRLFNRLPPTTIRKIHRKIRALCLKKGFTYEDKTGKASVIPLMLRPRLLAPSQRDRLWDICRKMNGAFEKAARFYLEDAAIREIFPFEEDEKKWVLDALRATQGREQAVFSRWDANTSFHGRNWVDTFSFFENNGVGIGGVWYCPVGEEILLETVIPELQKLDARLVAEKNHDARLLEMKFLLRHAKRLGRRDPLAALAIDRSAYENFIEFPRLQRFYATRGLRTVVADPREFVWKGGEIHYQGRKIDLVYRDTTIQEFVAFERKGADLKALYRAFLANRVVSSVAGEFDHKSLFEFFTNPAFAKYFTAEEKALFRKHVLWTRVVRESKTEGPRGKKIDLIPFIHKAKSGLVLKPNRLFGGEGVLIGDQVSPKEWEAGIEKGLEKRGEMIVQAHATVYQKKFPLLHESRRSTDDVFYVVTGFISTPDGLGILGRVSKRKVVNVARQGGISAILVCKNLDRR